MGNNPVEEGNDAAITFNYQDLVITNSSIRLGWTVTEQFICSLRFEVQQISSVTSPDVTSDRVIEQTDSTYAVILLNNTSNSHNFRIVAVFDNSSVCSDATSKDTLYYFAGTIKFFFQKCVSSLKVDRLIMAESFPVNHFSYMYQKAEGRWHA